MEKNDKFTAEILNYGCNAEGVAKVDGQIVFVPYTLVGEQISGVVINDKNKFAIAKANEILNQNPNRILPPCPYFKKCGGCQLQHANYNYALEIKTRIVQDAISNIGKLQTTVLPCIGSKQQYDYRNKISLPIDSKTRKLGMYRLASHSIIDIEKCLIEKPEINTLIEIFNHYLNKTKNSIYSEETKTGLLKSLVARFVNGTLLVTVVINGNKLDDVNILIELLKQEFSKFGLNLNINKQKNNVILSNNFVEVYGENKIMLSEDKIDYSINNRSFLQINEEIKSEIYSKVFDEIKGGVVIDAYSGAGLLSAMMSRHAKMVYGIEIVKPATELANQIKKQNKISNLQNINGDCSVELPKLVEHLKNESKISIVLDPPRRGCDAKVIEAVKNSGADKILYISCNPSTLARDLNMLIANGNYSVSLIQPYDMFPQTKHVETLAILALKRSNWFGFFVCTLTHC